MPVSKQLLRAIKPSTSAVRSSTRSLTGRNLASFAPSVQNATRASYLRSTASTSALQWRSLQTSSRCLAEEVSSGMPFESNVMNLLANNEEFKQLVGEFAARMNELLGIDVNAGQMPEMSDMMRCAQDPKLRELSIRLTKILQEDGVNLSPETLKLLWGNMQSKK